LTSPIIKGANLNSSEEYIDRSMIAWELFVICSNNECQNSFIGYYKMVGNNEFELSKISKRTL